MCTQMCWVMNMHECTVYIWVYIYECICVSQFFLQSQQTATCTLQHQDRSSPAPFTQGPAILTQIAHSRADSGTKIILLCSEVEKYQNHQIQSPATILGKIRYLESMSIMERNSKRGEAFSQSRRWLVNVQKIYRYSLLSSRVMTRLV